MIAESVHHWTDSNIPNHEYNYYFKDFSIHSIANQLLDIIVFLLHMQ